MIYVPDDLILVACQKAEAVSKLRRELTLSEIVLPRVSVSISFLPPHKILIRASETKSISKQILIPESGKLYACEPRIFAAGPVLSFWRKKDALKAVSQFDAVEFIARYLMQHGFSAASREIEFTD